MLKVGDSILPVLRFGNNSTYLCRENSRISKLKTVNAK